MKPFFSIIIPTFNSAMYIMRCISSIVDQKFKNWEIIIIDGKSNDNTIGIISKLRDNRIRLISESDEGPYDAMNKGIRLALGKWLYFLGSDDILYNENTLERVYTSIDIKKDMIIYGNVKVINDTDWAKDGSIYDGEFDLSKILIKNICHQGIFYNARVFIKLGGYNTKYKVCADWDFNLKCFAKYKLKYLDSVIAYFYGGNTSSNNNKDLVFGEDKWKNTRKYFKFKLYKKEFHKYYKKIIW